MSRAPDLQSMIFMKVGRHADETFEDIIERKRREYDKAGKIFWGYGGGTMHPISKLQPFVSHRIEHGDDITLVMQEIVSNHYEAAVATEYSKDGINWEPIPEGIEVRGSRYAVVLDEIQEGDLSFDLSEYRVGYGPSEGKIASNYIMGRVDKGCLVRADKHNEVVPRKLVQSRYFAKLQRPYGVLLRTTPKD
ncbi:MULTISPECIES: hypothetical protein [Microvirga]|uniref:Uncharacterized protein n=1 Tax=Microvirga mediterraneensis TaxID=2754695 RepID=A0A838BUJ1_9HYPH|nr:MULTISPECIES: hypothetical protein [Microvirga]MBA1158920.1 hypothetical protein [Microvirga mediterraneensis]MBQ0819365.1 hypothetical protein [Microvirga sp. HBU67558]